MKFTLPSISRPSFSLPFRPRRRNAAASAAQTPSGTPPPPFGELAPASGVSLFGALTSLALPDDTPPGGYGAYRKMLLDPQVKACLMTKKYAVLSGGWAVHAASPSPADQAVAAFVRNELLSLRGGLLDALADVLDALALGVSIVEIVYEPIETGPDRGKIGLQALKSKDPAGFTFETDAFANVVALRGVLGQTYPPAKFLRYAYAPLYENPLGQSDLRAAYAPWRSKQHLLRFWAKYLEKFGLPTVTGSYDSTRGYANDQQRDLLSIISQVHNESALVLPSDMHVSLLETSRVGAAGFQEAVEYLDRAIAKSILGQTLTTDGSGSGATYALGSVHQDVLLFHLRKLQKDLEDTVIGSQLIAPLVAYNFGPGAPLPSFALGALDDGKLAASGRLIADLVAGNVIAPNEPWIREYLGLPSTGEFENSGRKSRAKESGD